MGIQGGVRHTQRLAFATLAVWLMPALAETGLAQEGPPPIPVDVPLWMVGHGELDGSRLKPYSDVRFALGGAGKDGPLATGDRVEPAAFQVLSLTRERADDRDVWVRVAETYRAGEDEPVARAEIVLDRHTLAPIRSLVEQGGTATTLEYDWGDHRVRQTAPEAEDGSPTEVTLDLMSLEAGAHETWMAALPFREGFRVMIPTLLGVGGGKWWAVPRVTGSADIDLGDGTDREAWVVEMDWWGMGADHATFTPGGGINGTAGSGGKYWVLKEPLPGVPRVVRIRTEVSADRDRVLQIQDWPSGEASR